MASAFRGSAGLESFRPNQSFLPGAKVTEPAEGECEVANRADVSLQDSFAFTYLPFGLSLR